LHAAACFLMPERWGTPPFQWLLQVTTIKGVCEAATTSLHKPCRKLNYMGWSQLGTEFGEANTWTPLCRMITGLFRTLESSKNPTPGMTYHEQTLWNLSYPSTMPLSGLGNFMGQQRIAMKWCSMVPYRRGRRPHQILSGHSSPDQCPAIPQFERAPWTQGSSFRAALGGSEILL